MAVEIREHAPGIDIDDFIRAGQVVFRDDPAWIAPLEFDVRATLTPGKNPFFKRGEVTLFTAWKDGQLVGRTSAQVDHEHLKKYDDATGFFGAFDTVDDDEVGAALIEAAAAWLKERGMKRMRGPIFLNINGEIGTLIEGHQYPPAVLMAHSRPWQDRIALEAGLKKAKDLYAWRFEVGRIPKRAQKAWDAVQEMPEVRLRSVEPRRMKQELDIIMDIFNDAWHANWGFVPATPEEVAKAAEEMKLIIDKRISFIAEIDGRPVGMCICLPNLNEVTRDFGGKLGPIQLAKLLWRLKVKGPRSGRLMMLGIRSELRGIRKYAPLSHALYVEVAKRGAKLGYRWGELSWTLEDNSPMNAGIRSMGAKVYKKYRLYERPLVEA